ncbi:MAG: hypothetical protein ACPGRX_03615 [Bdellovibrionales bacterium]
MTVKFSPASLSGPKNASDRCTDSVNLNFQTRKTNRILPSVKPEQTAFDFG